MGSLLVKVYTDITAKERQAIFNIVSHMRGVEFVLDLSAITREALDDMLLPKQMPPGMSKVIEHRSERPRQEPTPITRQETPSLKQRLGR